MWCVVVNLLFTLWNSENAIVTSKLGREEARGFLKESAFLPVWYAKAGLLFFLEDAGFKLANTPHIC